MVTKSVVRGIASIVLGLGCIFVWALMFSPWVEAQGTSLPSPGEGCDSVEPDDQISEAQVVNVAFGQRINCLGMIGDGVYGATSGDHDFYRINGVAANETLTFDIDARPLGSSIDSYIVLYDAAGVEIARNDDSDSLDSFLELSAPVAGDYILAVGVFGEFLTDPFDGASSLVARSTGDYLLAIERSDREPVDFPPPPPPPTCEDPEDNGSIATATTALLFEECAGVIGNGPYAGTTGDFDVLAIPLQPGFETVVDLGADGAGISAQIVDADGAVLADFTDALIVGPPAVGGPTEAYLVIGPGGESLADPNDSASGSGLGTGVGADDVVNYIVRVDIQDAPVMLPSPGEGCDSVEPDDQISEAQLVDVRFGQQVSCLGTVGDGVYGTTTGDHDFYRISGVAEGETLTFDIDAHLFDSLLDSEIRLYDSAGVELARNDIVNGDLDSFLELQAPAAGDYFLAVGTFGGFLTDPFDGSSSTLGFSTGDYILTIERSDRGGPVLPRIYYSAYAAYPAEGAAGGFATKVLDVLPAGYSSIISLPAGTAAPGEVVELFLDDRILLNSQTANPDGSVFLSFMIPTGTSVGEHVLTLEFVGNDGLLYAVQHFIVVTAPVVVNDVQPPQTPQPQNPQQPQPAPIAMTPAPSLPPIVIQAVASPVVVTAASHGFGDQLPTTSADKKKSTALAHTGNDADVLAFLGTGLIALGAIMMGSRRRLP